MEKARVVEIKKGAEPNKWDVTVRTERGTFKANEELLSVDVKVGNMVCGEIDQNKVFVIKRVNGYESIHGLRSSLKIDVPDGEYCEDKEGPCRHLSNWGAKDCTLHKKGLVVTKRGIEKCMECRNVSEELPEWKLPVSWEMFGEVSVRAKNIEEAIQYFQRSSDLIKLPKGTYADASFDLTGDTDFVIEYARTAMEISKKKIL